MEVMGICMVCGHAGEMLTCRFCGSLVCERCFAHEEGICKGCWQKRV